MKIEFFHDVICSFCFPMSDRMHEIQQEFPDIELIHRSLYNNYQIRIMKFYVLGNSNLTVNS
ncbi:DSBA oxidoreductase [Enterococcus faecalis AZ19]|nr:DSBA oxidoreductase [Enterococcus faecalis AZ19]